MSKKNRETTNEFEDQMPQEFTQTTAPTPRMPERKTKAMDVLDAIRAGGATNETLMEMIGAKNATALYGQLSYLNTRGLNIYDVAPEKAEFPIKGEDGVYFMGSYDQFVAKKTAAEPKKPTKVYTPEEMRKNAQKRYDIASKRVAGARDKASKEEFAGDTIIQLRAELAEKNLELAHHLLEAVNNGNFEYERGQVKADTDSDA